MQNKRQGIEVRVGYIAPRKRKAILKTAQGDTLMQALIYLQDFLAKNKGKFTCEHYWTAHECELWDVYDKDKFSHTMVFSSLRNKSINLDSNHLYFINNPIDVA